MREYNMTRDSVPVGMLIEEIPAETLIQDRREAIAQIRFIEDEIYALQVQMKLNQNTVDAVDAELERRESDAE